MSGLRHKTINALKWSYLGILTNMLLQPLFVAVLSRLLTPQEFGVAAIGSVLANFGALLTDMGVGQALVQRRHLTAEHIRAGFTSSVLLGVLLTTVMWFLAPLAGHYANNSAVIPVFRGFASTYMLTALASVSISLLRRDLRFKPLAVADVSAYVIGHGVLGIGSAFLGFGAMSLVISTAAGALIQLVVTFAYVRHSFALTFRWAPYRDLYSFGARASALRMLEFLGDNVATFMIARLFGVTPLGLYNRAYNISVLPITRLAWSLMRVLVPSFSALQNERIKLRRAYTTSLFPLSVLLFTLAAGVFVCAPEIVQVLLGERFMAAVPIVQAFAVYVPFPILSNIGAIVAEATARLNIKLALQVAQLVFLVAGFWLAYRLGWGVAAFAWLMVLAAVLRSAAYGLVAARILGGGGRESLRAYLAGIGCGVAVAAVLFAVVGPLRMAGTEALVLFGLELALGTVLLAAIVFFGPDTELRGYALKTLRPLTGRVGGWLKAFGSSEGPT
ncbi:MULTISPECIES: lipopolysaccharide biosynthesis protein [Deinococcus]|uniref:Polysaccharide biosynthesis protein n=1 Tax=Deinococcus geothermalis (strain DSM 11300 / CIP 105573 / AG-3a) TaxID=319795 RepID=Q1J345_DEIGD|nr:MULTISPECIES: lipopolysaccharide biosynthesis protein [Deinococcus]ABF44089.1 polysaccharide biosynthesis protein [Deinococcus geothermalis DSM 11300]MBI0446283.1 lipopolysaccharide biosynthesis protein [Deinococcus sp. DB0503]TDE86171.1 lipopolysaccharide biosynthesis protein [Deinococcus sp. S9]